MFEGFYENQVMELFDYQKYVEQVIFDRNFKTVPMPFDCPWGNESIPREYVKDPYYLKQYRPDLFRLIVCKGLRFFDPVERKKSERGTANNEKLEGNIVRAKSTVKEILLCNNFELFVSVTLSEDKFDRYDLKGYKKALTQWLRNYSRLKLPDGEKIKFLLIPETHKDGAWHMHGFFKGLPESHLSDFVPGVHPQKLIDKGYKNWEAYEKKFGFCSVDKIKDYNKCVNYILKYISKDIAGKHDLNSQLYLCSRGLKRAEMIGTGEAHEIVLPDRFDFENDFAYGKWLDVSELNKIHKKGD